MNKEKLIFRGKSLLEWATESNQDKGLFSKMLNESNGCVGYLIEQIIGGDNFVNEKGYDYYLNGNVNQRVEIKSCASINRNTLRIQSFQQKRGRFEYMHIVDVINDREFIISAKKWFKKLGKTREFHWSPSYNELDSIQVKNTKWLLKNEYFYKENA